MEFMAIKKTQTKGIQKGKKLEMLSGPTEESVTNRL